MHRNPFEPKYDDDLLPLLREMLHQRPHLQTFVEPPDPRAISLLLYFRRYCPDGPPPEHLVEAALEALRLEDEVVA